MTNPTDRIDTFTRPDGSTLEIIRPGANLHPKSSNNWRLSKASFLAYRYLLVQAIDNWPQETVFTPADGQSINTFYSRLRDCKQALVEFDYDPELKVRFLANCKDSAFCMSPAGDCITFRSRKTAGRKRKVTTLGEEPTVQNYIAAVTNKKRGNETYVPLPDLHEFEKLCSSIESGSLAGPLYFEGTLDDLEVDRLTTKYDITLVYDLKLQLFALS